MIEEILSNLLDTLIFNFFLLLQLNIKRLVIFKCHARHVSKTFTLIIIFNITSKLENRDHWRT